MPRVTKEVLKGNELVAYIQEIVEFFKKYWEKLKVILLIVGVAVLFLVLLLLGNVRTNVSAMKEFNSALAIYQNQQVPAKVRYAQARDAFKMLVNNYSRSNIKYEAMFYLGSCQYSLGEYDEAIKTLTKCAPKLKKGPLGVYSLQVIGKSYEGKGNYEEALKVYQKALDAYPRHFLKANIELDIGRCYEKLNRINEAISTYQKILDFSPQSVWAREAKLRINILKG